MTDTQPEHADNVTGVIERVTFHSSDTGFSVLRVRVKGRRELATVVGKLPSVAPGEWIEAWGRWVVDSRHGAQLKAERLQTTNPTTLEGMRRYLGSGLIKGIGPHLARQLIGAFGAEVFDVIESQPERLCEVEGIGEIRQARIVAAWRQQRAIRDIMVFLHTYGVGSGRAARIYRTYGEQAVELITADPFCLARDVWGIGFQTADEIAARLGVHRHSEQRARAGIEYTLQQLTEQGHCACPRTELCELSSKLLDIPEEIVARALDEELRLRAVVQHEHEGRSLVCLSSLDVCEQLLAAKLARLSQGTPPCHVSEPSRAIDWVQQRLGITLAASQSRALRTALLSKVVVITGGPGVGKTTLVKSITAVMQAKGLGVRLAAPTGRAAKRLSEVTGVPASTIHRLLEFVPSTGGFKHDQNRPLAGDVFLVDEVSMIDVVLAHQLVRALPEHAGLVLVGDVDQLPSVGPGAVLADIIASGVIPVCRLTEVHRQASTSAIITNAHRVNTGQLPVWSDRTPVGGSDLDDFYVVECEDPEKAVRTVLRLVRERIPLRFGFDPMRDTQVITPMQKGVLGARNLNQVMQEALNPGHGGVSRFGVTFRAGDKVLQTINNYDKDVFNGDIGVVGEIRQEDQELDVRFDDRVVRYELNELDELSLAYALTVHKAQGSEYSCVVLPVHTQHYALLQANLLYTAITRGKKLVVVVGTVKALAIAVHNQEAAQRRTLLKRWLVEAAARRPD